MQTPPLQAEPDLLAQQLEALVRSVAATSGALWNAHDLRLLSIYPQEMADANVLLDPLVAQELLPKVKPLDGPVLCHPEESSAGDAHALLFGKILCAEPVIVGLAIPLPQLRQMNLETLKARFLETIRSVEANAATRRERPKTIQIRELSQYLTAINGSIHVTPCASAIANETRRLFDCDRVSVVVKQRGQFQLQAISGQHSINRRSQTTQLLEHLARKTLNSQQGFWYPEEALLPAQIGRALDAYLTNSPVRSLVVVPIFAHAPSESTDATPPLDQNTVIGGIVLEHFRRQWNREAVEPVVNMVTEHCSAALRNAIEHEQLFLFPVWHALGKSRLLTAQRTWPKLVSLVACLLLITALLVCWRVDFYVTADGVLMPERFKPVFAPAEGKVSQLLVQHGARVKAGEPLLVLSDPEHELRVREVESSLKTAQQRLIMFEDKRHTLRGEDPERIEENIASLKTQITHLELQLAVLQKISDSMSVKSPLDGQVVTWDLERKLQGRVVSGGAQLLEIAEVDQRWLLEIEVPVERLGHIQQSLEHSRPADLHVSFMLATDTSRRYTGHVASVENSVALSSSNQQVVRIHATVDDLDLTPEQIRSGVTARIYCDRTSLAYLMLHDALDFCHRHVLFKYF